MENIPHHRIPSVQDFLDNLTACVVFAPRTAIQTLPESSKPAVPMKKLLQPIAQKKLTCLWIKAPTYLESLDKCSQPPNEKELGEIPSLRSVEDLQKNRGTEYPNHSPQCF